MAKDVIVGGGNGYTIPQIVKEIGTTPSKWFKPYASEFKSREEKFSEAEADFMKIFKLENEVDLPSGSEGIVVIQQGHAPFDRDISLNPRLTDRCERQAINIPNKVMRNQPYVFASRTYWLNHGHIEQLLDGNSVLSMTCSRRAVEKIQEYKGGIDKEYQGTFLFEFGSNKHPYRVWKLKYELGFTYLVISLLNGSIFEIAPEDMPKKNEALGKFYVGAIKFVSDGHGNFCRQ